MADLRVHSNTSNIVRFVLKHSTTGQGLTGLTSASSGLIISTIADNEATATAYTVAGSTIETITTLGTFAAPTATKCRFKEVDATNHKGLYEFQFADARFAVASARRLIISVTGATNLLDTDYEIQLVQFNPYDAVRLGLTALPNVVAAGNGGLPTVDASNAVKVQSGTGANQISLASGLVTVGTNNDKTGYALSGTQTFNTTGNITGNLSGSVGSVTGAVGSVTGGVTVTTNSDKAGYSLATPQAFNLTGDITGNLSGSVGSVTGAVGSVTGGVTVTTNNDKTGYSLSVAGIQAIWDALTSALTTANSIGKLLVDNINATISSRSSHSAADVWAVVTRVLTAGTNIVLAKGTGVTGFNDLSAAEVNAEIVDALNVDTYAEPGQEAPPATTTLVKKIGYLYKAQRNKKTQTATTLSLYDDAGTTVDQKATISDDGTTYTHGELGTGP